MGTLYERIQGLCKSKGVSGSRMCLDLGMSKSTLSDMKNGRTKGLSMPNAQKIASYFGITVDELYGSETAKNEEKTTVENDGLTESQIKIIELTKYLSPEDADLILAALQAKIKQ